MGRLYLFSSYGIARKVSSLVSLTLLRSAYLRPSKLPTDLSAYSKSVLPSNRGAVNGFLPNREIAETMLDTPLSSEEAKAIKGSLQNRTSIIPGTLTNQSVSSVYVG